MPAPVIVVLVVAALAVIGWFATAQTSFVRAWLAWSGFCLILFPALVVAHGSTAPKALLAAAVLAPAAGLLGGWRQASLRSRVRLKRGAP